MTQYPTPCVLTGTIINSAKDNAGASVRSFIVDEDKNVTVNVTFYHGNRPGVNLSGTGIIAGMEKALADAKARFTPEVVTAPPVEEVKAPPTIQPAVPPTAEQLEQAAKEKAAADALAAGKPFTPAIPAIPAIPATPVGEPTTPATPPPAPAEGEATAK